MTNRAVQEDPKYWVKSVARAADILEVLATPAPGSGLSVTEVAQICGISKSAAFGTLQTLRAYGLVSDDGEGMNRRYRLGMGLSRLGDRARSQVSLRGVAHPVLRDLSRTTGMASRLAVPEDGHAVVVDQVELDHRVRLDLRMGQRELPHCTGLGKALLSALPEAEAAAVIERHGLPRRTRGPSPTRRPSSRICGTSTGSATRWTTRRTPRESCASARPSVTTGTCASAPSASPGSSSVCPPGVIRSWAARCGTRPSGSAKHWGGPPPTRPGTRRRGPLGAEHPGTDRATGIGERCSGPLFRVRGAAVGRPGRSGSRERGSPVPGNSS